MKRDRRVGAVAVTLVIMFIWLLILAFARENFRSGWIADGALFLVGLFLLPWMFKMAARLLPAAFNEQVFKRVKFTWGRFSLFLIIMLGWIALLVFSLIRLESGWQVGAVTALSFGCLILIFNGLELSWTR